MAVPKAFAIFFKAIAFCIFLLPAAALCSPSITGVALSPSASLWQGENLSISLYCNDTYGIKGVYANLSGPGIIFQNMPFSFSGGFYSLGLTGYHLAALGSYSVSAVCESNSNESIQQSIALEVSSLYSSINSMEPNEIYSGNEITVYFDILKNRVPIKTTGEDGPYFSVYVDGVRKSLKVSPPGYYEGKGWGLVIGPEARGSHTITASANYSRLQKNSSIQVEISDEIEFSIISLDKDTLKGGETLTVDLKAFERGERIELNSSNLAFFINGLGVEISTLAETGSVYRAQLISPVLNPGEYQFRARLVHNGISYFSDRNVNYLIQATGKLLDGADKPLYVQADFFRNNAKNASFSTDSSGTYSFLVKPGTYDISVKFPKATAIFKDVPVTSFNDPLRHDYVADPALPGIAAIAAFYFDIAMPFSYADIEMAYNERLVNDERELHVYECPNWNSGKRQCNSNWIESDSDFDYTRNMAKVHSNYVSAYAIGSRQNLSCTIGTDSQSYYVNQTIKASGIASSGSYRIANATVRLWIHGTNLNQNLVSGTEGEFFHNFLAAIPEGNYTITAEASRNPYGSCSASKKIEISRKREIYLTLPSTIRVEKGKEYTQEIGIVNSGQVSLSKLSSSFSGIPDEWYTIETGEMSLGIGENSKITIKFHVPDDAAEETRSAVFMITSNELSEARQIGFTVLAKTNQTVSIVQKAPSGSFLEISIPQISSAYAMAGGFIAILFSGAFIAKKMILKRKKSTNALLGELKNSMAKKEPNYGNSNQSQALSQPNSQYNLGKEASEKKK